MEWDEARIAALTKLWKDGLSAAQVARQLGGVSRSAVIGKVHRLGLQARETPTRPHAAGARPINLPRTGGGPPRDPSAARVLRVYSRPPERIDVAPTASIETLRLNSCRWPIGDPEEAGFGFCGRERAGPGSYCAGHARMSVRSRETPMTQAYVDRLVSRFVETGRPEPRPAIDLREIA